MLDYNLDEHLDKLIKKVIGETQDKNYEKIREQMIKTIINLFPNKELNIQEAALIDDFLENYTTFITVTSVYSVVNFLKLIGQNEMNKNS